jgi:carbon monoxide dehydrogenase subunit G
MYKSLQETIYIEAPLENVWELYDDPARLSSWAPNVLDVQVVGGLPKRLGSRIAVTLKVGGIKQRVEEEVVRYEPPHVATQRGRSSGMTYDVSISLHREANGTWCSYTCAPAYEGLMRLLAPIGDMVNRGMLRSALKSLKAAAEREAASAGYSSAPVVDEVSKAG